MKQRGGKSPQVSSVGAVRLQGYARPPRHLSPRIRLGTVALIVIAVAIAAVFRHPSHRSGGGQPSAAASLPYGSAVSQSRPASFSPAPSTVTLTNRSVAGERLASLAPSQQVDGDAIAGQSPQATTHAATKATQARPTVPSTPETSAGSDAMVDTSIVHAGGVRRYHVQVGKSANRATAERLVERLRSLGYAVRIAGTGPFFVWVGGYLDPPTAGRLMGLLRKQGFDAVLNSEKRGTPLVP